MRRVTFVNRYFHPDHSATSQIASDLAMQLAGRGWEVVAITSRQRYDDARARLAPHEVASGVTIRRVWSTRFGRAGLLGRAVDYGTFYVSAFFAVLAEAGRRAVPRRSSGSSAHADGLPRNAEEPRGTRGTIIVAMTDPPLLSVIVALAAMLRGARLVNWLQDLFPEVGEALGMRALRVLRSARDWSLRRARLNVVLGERMRERVPDARVIHNWADAALRPLPPPAEFTVGYSGNLGRAHDAQTIVEAMRLAPEIRFVFIGGGAQMERVRRAGLPNIEIRPYAPREQLSESLSSVDVHLVSLQPSMEGLIVPSKFYGILAVARPVIFIGARDGEVARLIDEARCGFVIDPGDAAGLARAVRELASDREQAMEMGRRGRAMYEERFAPRHAFARWEAVLEEAAR